MKSALTQKRLKELLHYDPETGHFTWLVSRGRSAANSRAGTPHSHGYLNTQVDGARFYNHQLAFLYMEGEIPPEVDHINRDKTDNRWSNLRPATRRENMGNVGLQSNNTSGHRGVAWYKRYAKWRVLCKRDGRQVYLGYFTSLEEAVATAQKWREENFGEFVAS